MLSVRPVAVSLLVASLVVLSAAPPAQAATAAIQPGLPAFSSVGQCTFNFVFTDATSTYIGLAAHCISQVGAAVMACVTAPVVFTGSCNIAVVGRVAAMGRAGSVSEDWALVRIEPEYVGSVNPAVRGHTAAPVGSTRASETTTGSPLWHSGYGLGYETNQVTRESRIGFLVGDSATSHSCICPVLFGDSGGPIVDLLSNKALGIVSSIPFGCPCTEAGPTVEGILIQAAQKGLPVQLRTV